MLPSPLPLVSGGFSLEERRERVDVIVVTWNTGELTAEALRRLLDHDQGCDVRLLVRDNGSSDGTVQTLARLVPEAEVEAGSENLGFAAGVNKMLERSNAPWVFLLNSDAWPEFGAIRRLIETARRHPKAAAVAPRLEYPRGGLQHSTHPFPSLRVAAVSAFVPRRIGPRRGEAMMLEGFWKHDRPRRVDWAIGAALLIRREALDDIGSLDDRFFMYVEDLEWSWRALLRGWEIQFEPSAIVRHVGNASGDKDLGARARAYLLNTNRFFRREHGVGSLWADRGLNVIGCSFRYLGARRRGDRSAASFWWANIRAHFTRLSEVEERAASRRHAEPSRLPGERNR
ncbi:MAG: glycosyltransferase family 2 protein [Actinomycetota bacterium]